MQDRYLYRAKRKNWRELQKERWWVEGYYVRLEAQERDAILVDAGGILFIDIEPSTICQCTGREDEWEHDIFHYDEERYEIQFCKESLTWEAVSIFSSESIELGEFSKSEYVRIGNSIDNPELLEVGE